MSIKVTPDMIRGAKAKKLEKTMNEMAEVISMLVEYVGNMPTECDKCDNFEDPGISMCVKCESNGIVKHKQLFNWPW